MIVTIPDDFDLQKIAASGQAFRIAQTPQGWRLLAGDKLFSGDTLFFRSVGRSDLSTGNQQMLENSIRNRLFCLDDNIEVFPGHGDSTFIGYEKENNLYVRM